MLIKFRRPRALFEADGGNGGGGAGGDGGAGGAGEGADQKATDLAKAQAEIARLGKLLNDKAEADKAREAEEVKKQEEEQKKRGEFEKLYGDTKTQFDELTGKHTTATETLTKYEEYFKTQYETSLKSLAKEQKETLEKLLDGKSNFDKASLLPSILAQFGGKGFGKDPNGGGGASPVDKSKELLAKGDVRGSLGVKLSGL